MPRSLADQIKDLENTRAAKVARMEELTNKSIEEGRSFETDEAEEFDDLKMDIKQIDADHTRYTELHRLQQASAVPVQEKRGEVEQGIAKQQGPMVFARKADPDDKFQGQTFTRVAIAKAIGKMEGVHASTVAEARWGKTHPNLVAHMKADIAGGGTGSGEWGAELVYDQDYTGDFIEYLHGMTVYNQLPLREVPANVNIKGQDGAATGYWVGESAAIPVSAMDFSNVSLAELKVAALSAISKELIRHADPSVEVLVRDQLAEAAAQRIDQTFISSTAGTAGTTPAGILYNIPGTLSAGTDIDGVINDIKELRQRFITANNTGGLVWVMSKSLASSLSLLRNALGQKEFTELNQEGGTLEGNPVYVGDNVNDNHLILLKPSDIYKIGMRSMEVSVSEHATLEMSDAPAQDLSGPTSPTQKTVNVFQTDSMAFKVVMPINFARRRESAVAWIKDADYGGGIST